MKSPMLATTCRRCNRPMHIINPNAPGVISARVGSPEKIIAHAQRLCEHCLCEQVTTTETYASDKPNELLS